MLPQFPPLRVVCRQSLLLVLVSGLAAGATLSLSSGSGFPGSTVAVAISVGATGDLPAAAEWEVSYSTTDFSAVTLSAGPAATNKSLSCAAGSGTATCLLWGLNNQAITNGVVATLNLTISGSTTTTSSPVQFFNAIMADSAGNAISTSATGGTITILPSLNGLSCVPTSISPSIGSTCSINLTSAAASGGATVSLNSAPAGAIVPSTVTVPGGSTYTTFQVTAASVASPTQVMLTASYGAQSANIQLIVDPASRGTSDFGDLGVFRSGQWWLLANGAFSWTGAPLDRFLQFGEAGDIPLIGDWDNTGVRRIGVFRQGQWWLDMNNDGVFDAGDIVFWYGEAGDIPVFGDWDHTGVQRIGVFRQGQWWVDMNNDHQWDPVHDIVFSYGAPGDIPIVGDWNNTGWLRIGIFRNGQWWLDMNGDHVWDATHDIEFSYGTAGDIPVIGDWDHQGLYRIGVFRQSQWWLDMNDDHVWDPIHDIVVFFGIATDTPVVAQ